MYIHTCVARTPRCESSSTGTRKRATGSRENQKGVLLIDSNSNDNINNTIINHTNNCNDNICGTISTYIKILRE